MCRCGLVEQVLETVPQRGTMKLAIRSRGGHSFRHERSSGGSGETFDDESSISGVVAAKRERALNAFGDKTRFG